MDCYKIGDHSEWRVDWLDDLKSQYDLLWNFDHLWLNGWSFQQSIKVDECRVDWFGDLNC